MPNYRGHLVGGVFTYLVMIAIATKTCFPISLKINTLISWFIALLLGSLFPDIDVISVGQKFFFYFIFVTTVIVILLQEWNLLFFLGLAAFFPLCIRHRGIMHHPLFVITTPLLIPVAINYYQPAFFNGIIIITLFFIAGAMSHLILDFGLVKVIKLLCLLKRI